MSRIVTLCVFSLCLSTHAFAQPVAAQQPPQSEGLADGAARGVLVGAAGMAGLVLGALNWCGEGCNEGSPGAMLSIASAVGAGIGALVGYLADRDSTSSTTLGPRVIVGATLAQDIRRSKDVRDRTPSPGGSIGARLSRHMSFRVEWSRPRSALLGEVSEDITGNVIPATPSSGRLAAVERVHVKDNVGGLVGVHPWSGGRVQLALLAGMSVQKRETHEYLGAFACSGTDSGADPLRCVPAAGKYQLRRFETPTIGVVVGLDADVALTSRLAIVPTLRVERPLTGARYSELSVRPGVGLSVRF